jgi:hypothetical protein
MSTVSTTADTSKMPANEIVRDSRATVEGRDSRTSGRSSPLAQKSGETAGASRGRPFPPGVSGNPGGRPKSLSRATRELVGEDGRKLAELWWSIARDVSQKTSDRLEASRLLADRGWGKSVDFKPIEEDDPFGLEEAREKLLARLAVVAPMPAKS